MALVWAAVGLVVGGFLDLAIRALTAARANPLDALCPACDLPRFDRRLLPVVGALWAGACPNCGRRHWLGSVAIAVASAGTFAALVWRFPPVLALLVFSLFSCILISVCVVDLRHRLILNVVTYPSMLFALAMAGFLLGPSFADGLGRALLGGFFGGGLFFGLYLLAILIYRRDDALGLGDVKLALLIGLMVGWPGAMAAILLGSLFGAIIGVALMVRTRSSRATMPYGTALALGSIVSVLWHPPA